MAVLFSLAPPLLELGEDSSVNSLLEPEARSLASPLASEGHPLAATLLEPEARSLASPAQASEEHPLATTLLEPEARSLAPPLASEEHPLATTLLQPEARSLASPLASKEHPLATILLEPEECSLLNASVCFDTSKQEFSERQGFFNRKFNDTIFICWKLLLIITEDRMS